MYHFVLMKGKCDKETTTYKNLDHITERYNLSKMCVTTRKTHLYLRQSWTQT